MKIKGQSSSNSAKRRRATSGFQVPRQSRREQQDTRLRTLNQLVQVLSHETRNILGSFVTCLELLRRSTQLNQNDRELVDILQSGSRRLNEISEQFAVFGPRAPLRFESVEVAALIAGIVERLRQDERCSEAVEIRVQCDPGVRNVAADRNFLGKSLWNLFLNAVQAMGTRGTLEIETQQTGENLEIHIRDTGPGIPASLRAKIFEPLFTTKTRAAGLGLAIARRIAEEHGGALKLHTGQQAGGHFTLALPLGSTTEVAYSRERLRPAAQPKKNHRIRSRAHKNSRTAGPAVKAKGRRRHSEAHR